MNESSKDRSYESSGGNDESTTPDPRPKLSEPAGADDLAVLVLGLVILVAGAYVLFLGSRGLSERVIFNQSSIVSSGSVTSTRHSSSFWNGHQCRLTVVVDSVGIATSRARGLDQAGCDLMLGKTLSVAHLPDDPERAVVGLKEPYGGWPIFTIMLGLGGIVIGMWVLASSGSRIYRPLEALTLFGVTTASALSLWLAIQSVRGVDSFNTDATRSRVQTEFLTYWKSEDVYGPLDSVDCYRYVEANNIPVSFIAHSGEGSNDCRELSRTVAFDPSNPKDAIVGRNKSALASVALVILAAITMLTAGITAIYSSLVSRVVRI